MMKKMSETMRKLRSMQSRISSAEEPGLGELVAEEHGELLAEEHGELLAEEHGELEEEHGEAEVVGEYQGVGGFQDQVQDTDFQQIREEEVLWP